MQRTLLLAGCLLAGSVAAPAAAEPVPALFWIPGESHQTVPRLAGSDVAPVLSVDGFTLAWGDPASLPGICSLGLDAIALGPRLPRHGYAVAFLPGRGGSDPIVPLDRIGQVLWRGERCAILAFPEARRGLLIERYEQIPILDRPLRQIPARSYGVSARGLEPDPRIQACVDRVDRDSLIDVARMLQDFGSRRSETAGGVAAGEYLLEKLRAAGIADVHPFDYNHWSDNIVAFQPGQVDPGEIYVIGAHYDSYSAGGAAPGADDNASGTAAVVEAARVLAPLDFESTILYIAFSGEEQGLVGSEAWASRARALDLDIRGMINLDMIGYRRMDRPRDIDLIANVESFPLRDLAAAVIETYLPSHASVEGYLSGGGSDHMSFWGNGYPAIFFFEDSEAPSPYIHTPQDVIGLSLNDEEFLRSNAQAAVGLLATLARPVRVRIDHDPIADPPAEEPAYEVRARIRGIAPLLSDSLAVFYRVERGERRRLSLHPTGEPDEFAATIPRQIPGTLVEYAISARDIEGRSSRLPSGGSGGYYAFVVGNRILFAETFDEDRGWVVGAADDGAASGIWVRATPVGTGAQPSFDASGDSAGVCFVTGNGTAGEEVGAHDVDGGRTTLTSPRIDLSGMRRITLECSVWFVDETFPDDTLRISISSDDGERFVPLARLGGRGRAWGRVRIERLEEIVPPTAEMRLRFVAEDVASPSLVEAAIDNVTILGAPAIDLHPDLDRRGVAAHPSPFREGTRIYFEVASPVWVRLEAYDAAGRLVRRIRNGPAGPGRHDEAWDGTDDAGNRVPSGVYFLRLYRQGSPDRSARVVRLQ